MGIQVAICGFLWNVLRNNPLLTDDYWHRFSLPGFFLHLAWLAFAVSLLLAAFTLIRLPKLVESLQQNEEAAESVFALPVKILSGELALKKLVGAQYIFFLAGAVLAAVFVIIN